MSLLGMVDLNEMFLSDKDAQSGGRELDVKKQNHGKTLVEDLMAVGIDLMLVIDGNGDTSLAFKNSWWSTREVQLYMLGAVMEEYRDKLKTAQEIREYLINIGSVYEQRNF